MTPNLSIRLSCLLAVFALLTSCASLSPQPYQVNAAPDPHLSFSGRGAAAGPMLMGAMGPAGIAVGLAIDVGIAKDIEKNAFAKGLDVNALFSAAVAEMSKTSTLDRKFFSRTHKPNFALNKIGFIELPGQNDHVVPQIDMTITRATWTKTYRYPEEFKVESPARLPGASLEQLKSTQPPTQDLLRQAMVTIINRGQQDWEGSVK